MRGCKMGKVMTWEQIKEKYPDRWVFVKNYTMDGADIASGEIICVCTDEEYPSTAIKIMDSGIDFSKERTTHEDFGGFINAENATFTLE